MRESKVYMSWEGGGREGREMDRQVRDVGREENKHGDRWKETREGGGAG